MFVYTFINQSRMTLHVKTKNYATEKKANNAAPIRPHDPVKITNEKVLNGKRKGYKIVFASLCVCAHVCLLVTYRINIYHH